MIITPGGRITDVTIGGHSVAAALSAYGTRMDVHTAAGGELTTLSLVLVVDEVTIAPPPAASAYDTSLRTRG